MDVTTIGKQIAALRRERGIKQEELAGFVGVTAQAVSKWENGGVPDTELIPKIADFFGVSCDKLFGRSVSDYADLRTALAKKIFETPLEERFDEAFECCWAIEKALYCHELHDDDVAEYRRTLGKKEQRYSSMLTDDGFTRMGIANRMSYFLLVPEIEDTETALFEGIDYPAFFKDMSDREFFDACVLLNKRDHRKAFTAGLLVKRMGLTQERAMEILQMMRKYHLIGVTSIEMDDETQEVYTFRPTPSFVAFLIFTRELIERPRNFSFYSEMREKPYLQE